MDYKYEIINGSILKCLLIDDNKTIGKCLVSFDYLSDFSNWTISGWYISKDFQNKGVGKELLRKTLLYLYKNFGEPNTIKYIWNGQNIFVYNWLAKNFDAVSNCPMVVQKYQSDDDWESHIYDLNKTKILDYFNISKEP